MSSFVWYKPSTWFAGTETKLTIAALPISVTTTARSTVVLKRHAGRLSRLMQIKENGEATVEMLAEMDKLGHLLAAEGNPIPKNLKEALALRTRLGG